MQKQIDEEYIHIRVQNEEAGFSHCRKLLDKLSGKLQSKHDQGEYHVPGGYKLYKVDLDSVKREYGNTKGKGDNVRFCQIQSSLDYTSFGPVIRLSLFHVLNHDHVHVIIIIVMSAMKKLFDSLLDGDFLYCAKYTRVVYYFESLLGCPWEVRRQT